MSGDGDRSSIEAPEKGNDEIEAGRERQDDALATELLPGEKGTQGSRPVLELTICRGVSFGLSILEKPKGAAIPVQRCAF